MAKKIEKPGVWWTVRFRRRKSYERITGYLTCANAAHAGHNGFKRRFKRKRVKGVMKTFFRQRRWNLKNHSNVRFAYKFAELGDLRSALRTKQVKEWLEKWDGIAEIIKFTGCTYHFIVEKEEVVERKFQTTNEMEIIALEHALGE